MKKPQLSRLLYYYCTLGKNPHIKKIRRKMAAVLPDRELIHAVYSVGYKYEW